MSNPVILPLERVTKAIDRELGMRRRVYPNRVHEGKMKIEQATAETLNMQAAKDMLTTACDLLKSTINHLEAKDTAAGLQADIREFLGKACPQPKPPAQRELF